MCVRALNVSTTILTCEFCQCTAPVVLEAAFLTGVVVASLTLYTFWAVKRGKDFSFLGPFLFASLLVLMMFALIQVNIN
jgi:protein lifeguard